jgi:hypothetical protein
MNEAPKAGMDMYTATGRKTKSDEMATYAPLVRLNKPSRPRARRRSASGTTLPVPAR